MTITINGYVEGKIQLLSFKTWPKWFARMGFRRFKKNFNVQQELDMLTGSQTIKVPGPLDILIKISQTPTGYLISAAIIEDNTKIVIFETEEDVITNWSGDFETKILGNKVKGTITVE